VSDPEGKAQESIGRHSISFVHEGASGNWLGDQPGFFWCRHVVTADVVESGGGSGPPTSEPPHCRWPPDDLKSTLF